MTLYGLVGSLAWCALAFYALRRADIHIGKWINVYVRAVEPLEEIPPDLLALAMSETEEWAQSQTVKVIREKYAEYHDWQAVRTALGVATVHKVA